jgi:hypothetical protein
VLDRHAAQIGADVTVATPTRLGVCNNLSHTLPLHLFVPFQQGPQVRGRILARLEGL